MPDKEIKERVEVHVKKEEIEERKEVPREDLKCTCAVAYRDIRCKKHHSIP